MTSREIDLGEVGRLVDRVAVEVVLPHFRDLAPEEVHLKGPGDYVTDHDLEAERVITAALAEIAPGVPVVGEEAVAADEGVLRALHEPLVFVVDPIDGTRAFVEGTEEFSVMVALVERGEPVAAWVALPAVGERVWGVRGEGLFLDKDGRSERIGPRPRHEGVLRVGLAARTPAAPVPGLEVSRVLGAGDVYRDLVVGELDAVVFHRTRPWDHAPGAVFLRELGGVLERWDGTPYRADDERDTLLGAASTELAARVRAELGLA